MSTARDAAEVAFRQFPLAGREPSCWPGTTVSSFPKEQCNGCIVASHGHAALNWSEPLVQPSATAAVEAHEMDCAATATWMPGALDLLASLRGAELPWGVVTRNTRQAYAWFDQLLSLGIEPIELLCNVLTQTVGVQRSVRAPPSSLPMSIRLTDASVAGSKSTKRAVIKHSRKLHGKHANAVARQQDCTLSDCWLTCWC